MARYPLDHRRVSPPGEKPDDVTRLGDERDDETCPNLSGDRRGVIGRGGLAWWGGFVRLHEVKLLGGPYQPGILPFGKCHRSHIGQPTRLPECLAGCPSSSWEGLGRLEVECPPDRRERFLDDCGRLADPRRVRNITSMCHVAGDELRVLLHIPSSAQSTGKSCSCAPSAQLQWHGSWTWMISMELDMPLSLIVMFGLIESQSCAASIAIARLRACVLDMVYLLSLNTRHTGGFPA